MLNSEISMSLLEGAVGRGTPIRRHLIIQSVSIDITKRHKNVLGRGAMIKTEIQNMPCSYVYRYRHR